MKCSPLNEPRSFGNSVDNFFVVPVGEKYIFVAEQNAISGDPFVHK